MSGPLDVLRSAIEKGQALVLVGAGVSIGATRGQVVQVGKKKFPLASWTGLLHRGVTYCEQWVKADLPRGWSKAVRAEINVADSGSLIGAGTKIEEKLKAPEGLYIKWLQSTVGALKIVDDSVLAAIAKLATLGLPIATTNYDRLIEAITSQPAVNWTQRHKVQPILRGDEKGIIHLHGEWDDPKSIVLGHRTYAAVERDPQAQAMLHDIFSSRTVLLVGFGGGLSDPNFGPLLKWVAKAFASSTYPHFLLCLEKDLKSLKLDHPIQPLDYGKTHADLAPFLLSLVPSRKGPPPGPGPPGTNWPRWLINFPRNPGFLGREDELTRLHAALSGSGSGPVGIRPAGSARAAGLIGMGGIGKTQLAVEYSYRQHEAGTYPDGIFWINAAEPLDQGFARLARDLGVAVTDQALDQQVRSAFDALGRWEKALLVLDNLEDPGTLNRPIVSGCIPAGLSCRLLFTTRRRDLGGFTPVEVTVLPEDSALQLLLRHPNRQPAIEPSHPDHEPAVTIIRMLGRLPLALELAGAYLGKWSDRDKPGFVSLSGYRKRLRTRGRLTMVDVGAKKLSDNELQSIHEDAVEATLRQQWDALDDEDARRLLLVAGQLPEAAVIPNERLGLLAGVAVRSDDGEGPSSLDEALRRLEDDCLVEELRRDQVRLHPLVREFAERLTPADTRDAFRLACAGRMAAAYEDYATLEEMARKHPGLTPLEDDLFTALSFCASDDRSVQPRLQSLLRVLQRESHHLRTWDPIQAPAFFPQQIRNRAFLLGLEPLIRGAETRLASSGRGHALLRWRASLESPALVRTLSGHGGWVSAVALTGDGRVVSGSYDGTVKVWDLDSGQEQRTLSGHGEWVHALALTGDGRVVCASDDGTVKVWNLNSGQEQRTLLGDGGVLLALALTGDGRVVTGSSDGTVKVWNLDSGQEQRTLSGHGGVVWALALTGDGRVVSASDDGTVKVWDLDSGHEERTLSGHGGGVWALALTGDGRVVSGSGDGTVKVWDLNSGQEQRTLSGHGSGVNALALTGDGRLVTGSSDGTVKVWNLNSGQEQRTLSGHGRGVNALALTGDGRVVSGSGDGTVKVWDLNSGQEQRTLSGHGSGVWALALTGDGRVISSSEDGTVKVWDVNSGHEERTLSEQGGEVRGLALTGDGRLVNGSSDGTVRVWDVSSGHEERTLSGPGSVVIPLALTGDGRVVSGSFNGTLKVWDLASGQEQRTLSGHGGGVNALALTGDGRVVSGSHDGTVKVWDLNSGQEQRTLSGHGDGVRGLALTGDGRVVSGSKDGTVKVWDLNSGQEQRTLSGHGGGVNALALTGDGRVISGSDDGTLKVWDLNSGSCLATVSLDSIPQSLDAKVGADGITLVVGEASGAVSCFRLVLP